MLTISAMQEIVHKLAVDKGWHEMPLIETVDGKIAVDVDGVAAKLMLIVSELSEALEEMRVDPQRIREVHYAVKKPEGFGVELADAVIRIMDLCGALDIDIESLISIKHAYNETRSRRHGNKAL